ncbi:hypothetical protein B5P41_34425, partial [Bacillus sp. SRB_28]
EEVSEESEESQPHGSTEYEIERDDCKRAEQEDDEPIRMEHGRRSDRVRNAPGEWWKVPPAAALIVQRDRMQACQITLPKSISEATDPANEFSEEWTQATNAEFTSLQENQTWELCPLPIGRQAIA